MHLVLSFILMINALWNQCTVIAEYTAISSLNDGLHAEDEKFDLEPINGTHDYRINIAKDLSDKPWHDIRKDRYITHCVRQAHCEKLNTTTCFGAKIPYKYTSLALTDSRTQAESREELYRFEAFRNVPKCWAVIQPFLCAVFMPKCKKIADKKEKNKEREYVYLPSFEMCRITSEPCRILYNTSFFPEFLKCRETIFPCKDCSNDVREMKFNATGQCLPPLVATESITNYYKDIEGCGLQCKDPLYTDEEHEAINDSTLWKIPIGVLSCIFVVATLHIHEWKHTKYPSKILFYISICFLCYWFGWLLQFWPGYRENAVCRDGTLRYSEPSDGVNACVVQFAIIYYFSIAASVWFALFTYSWYLQTTDRGSVRDRIDKESSYFHFVAWALPFVLTVTIWASGEVDGNSITGVCFVGYRNHAIRIGFVLLPFAILSCIFIIFAFKGVINLNRIKKRTNNCGELKKLNSFILGVGIRTMLVVFFTIAFVVFETYEMRNAEHWASSLNEFIICKIRNSHSHELSVCKLKNRPSMAILKLRLLCLFCVNLVISSWCWTRHSLKTWNRYIRKKLGYELSEDEKFTKPKHRIIADAYAKRGEEVISVSIQNSRRDPANLNFELNNLNSTESNGMGTTLTNYLYNLINRRNAVAGLDFDDPNYTKSQSNNCAYGSSCDSEISFSVRQISLESRRSSIDSQVSVKMSETEIKAKVERHSQNYKRVNMKAKKRHSKYFACRTNRRASSSSIESQRVTDQMQNIKYKYPNSERRMANVNLKKEIKQLLNLTTSEDDQSNNEQILAIQEPSNMIVPLGYNGRQAGDSDDKLETMSNEKQKQILQEALAPFLHNLLQSSNENQQKQLKDLLKNSCDRNDHRPKSMNRKSMRSSSHSKPQPQHHQRQRRQLTAQLNEMTSSVDLDKLQSSFSDESVGSKRSCTVNIEANDTEAVTYHVRNEPMDGSLYEKEKDDLPEKLQSNYQENDEEFVTEAHPMIAKRREALSIVPKKDRANMSESKKQKYLEILLHPSKPTL